MTKTQPFPLGAAVRRGYCDGVFCFTKREKEPVADMRLGATWRTALAMDLCAGCLADFVKAGTVIDNARVYVLALDGLYHEVKGGVTPELVEAEP